MAPVEAPKRPSFPYNVVVGVTERAKLFENVMLARGLKTTFSLIFGNKFSVLNCLSEYIFDFMRVYDCFEWDHEAFGFIDLVGVKRLVNYKYVPRDYGEWPTWGSTDERWHEERSSPSLFGQGYSSDVSGDGPKVNGGTKTGKNNRNGAPHATKRDKFTEATHKLAPQRIPGVVSNIAKGEKWFKRMPKRSCQDEHCKMLSHWHIKAKAEKKEGAEKRIAEKKAKELSKPKPTFFPCRNCFIGAKMPCADEDHYHHPDDPELQFCQCHLCIGMDEEDEIVDDRIDFTDQPGHNFGRIELEEFNEDSKSEEHDRIEDEEIPFPVAAFIDHDVVVTMNARVPVGPVDLSGEIIGFDMAIVPPVFRAIDLLDAESKELEIRAPGPYVYESSHRLSVSDIKTLSSVTSHGSDLFKTNDELNEVDSMNMGVVDQNGYQKMGSMDDDEDEDDDLVTTVFNPVHREEHPAMATPPASAPVVSPSVIETPVYVHAIPKPESLTFGAEKARVFYRETPEVGTLANRITHRVVNILGFLKRDLEDCMMGDLVTTDPSQIKFGLCGMNFTVGRLAFERKLEILSGNFTSYRDEFIYPEVLELVMRYFLCSSQVNVKDNVAARSIAIMQAYIVNKLKIDAPNLTVLQSTFRRAHNMLTYYNVLNDAVGIRGV